MIHNLKKAKTLVCFALLVIIAISMSIGYWFGMQPRTEGSDQKTIFRQLLLQQAETIVIDILNQNNGQCTDAMFKAGIAKWSSSVPDLYNYEQIGSEFVIHENPAGISRMFPDTSEMIGVVDSRSGLYFQRVNK